MDIENLLNKLPRLNLEDKLYLNRFKVNNGHPHLSIKHKELCQLCEEKSCVYVCPVENYKIANGEIELSWEGCLECGSCRIACKYGAIEWNYPQGGFGIIYRFG